jgi:hypothetical protein
MITNDKGELWDIILYKTENGECPVEIFIESINDPKLKAKILRDLDLLEEKGNLLCEPQSKPIKDTRGSLFELRSKQSSNITRIFYYFRKGRKIVLLNGFVKKSNNIPPSELFIAFAYKKDWEERNYE